jgi:hypothetical protein
MVTGLLVPILAFSMFFLSSKDFTLALKEKLPEIFV